MNNYGHQQVTMIENLPELDDLEETKQNELPEQNLQKFIRRPQVLSPDSGMISHPQQHQQQPSHPQPSHPQPSQQQFRHPGYIQQMSCLDIAHHVQECLICSKFYNNDKSVYIISIVVLAILCLLLIKKVMNL